MKMFPIKPKPGMPLSMKGLAVGLQRMAYAWENLTCYGGRVIWGPDGAPKIMPGIVGSEPYTPAPLDIEWTVRITVETATITTGVIVWSDVKITPAAATLDLDLSAMELDDVRWIYVEADIAAQTAVVALSADENKMTNDPANMLIRRNLLCVKRVTSNTGPIVSVLKAWSGEIVLGNEFNPPRA